MRIGKICAIAAMVAGGAGDALWAADSFLTPATCTLTAPEIADYSAQADAVIAACIATFSVDPANPQSACTAPSGSPNAFTIGFGPDQPDCDAWGGFIDVVAAEGGGYRATATIDTGCGTFEAQMFDGQAVALTGKVGWCLQHGETEICITAPEVSPETPLCPLFAD